MAMVCQALLQPPRRMMSLGALGASLREGAAQPHGRKVLLPQLLGRVEQHELGGPGGGGLVEHSKRAVQAVGRQPQVDVEMGAILDAHVLGRVVRADLRGEAAASRWQAGRAVWQPTLCHAYRASRHLRQAARCKRLRAPRTS